MLPTPEFLNLSAKKTTMTNKHVKNFLVSLVAFTICIYAYAENNKEKNAHRIIFYNTENLFDTYDDSIKHDEEFLPDGSRSWNKYKLNNKLKRIFQVIMASSEGNMPTAIGLCEIENLYVLEALLDRTPLGKLGYKIVHKESPDRRGIDVAFLYNVNKFTPITYEAISVVNPNDKHFATRDILYVKGCINNDTLHFFVNHWPSKYGGTIETIPLRALAAKHLRNKTDSIMQKHVGAKIIVMGDFNDSPIDESITKHLQAFNVFENINDTSLYNLSYNAAQNGIGSIKFRGKWELIDQFIVSGALITSKGMYTPQKSFTVFRAPFLMEKDEGFLGEKPFRTYIGFKYNNGFSDHLPVYIDLYHKEKNK